jgi:heterotetrameric sarcosine oxidase gamma subunit
VAGVTLAFLGTGTRPGGPPAESPLAAAAAAAGARCDVQDGWRVAAGYGDLAAETRACRASVAWADVSHLAKLELHAQRGRPGALGAFAARVADVTLAAGTGVLAEDAWWCRLTSTRALLLAGHDAGTGWCDSVGDTGGVSTLDVTASHGALMVVGPLARETIARFCALDLRPAVAPVGAFRPGSIARAPGFVLREGDDRYRLLFPAAYALYLWQVVADAADHLGGRPVGVDAVAATTGVEARA